MKRDSPEKDTLEGTQEPGTASRVARRRFLPPDRLFIRIQNSASRKSFLGPLTYGRHEPRL